MTRNNNPPIQKKGWSLAVLIGYFFNEYFHILRKKIKLFVKVISPGTLTCEGIHRSPQYRSILRIKSVALVRERTKPTERPPFVGEVVLTFADRGCRVVSATDPTGR
jgi:hypothetical protein